MTVRKKNGGREVGTPNKLTKVQREFVAGIWLLYFYQIQNSLLQQFIANEFEYEVLQLKLKSKEVFSHSL